MKRNPFLKGKIEKRKKARERWLERQLRPARPKDPRWAEKFHTCPHLGVLLSLKHELDDALLWEFEADTAS